MPSLADYSRLLELKGYDGGTPEQLSDAVNEGRRRLVQDRRWSFLDSTDATLVTVPNEATVALAGIADLAHVDAVRPADVNGEDFETRFVSWQELRQKQSRCPLVGLPEYWSRRAGQIGLYPTPDRAYTLTVEYVAAIADLVDDDPLFPDAMKDLVVWAAVPTLAFRQRDSWAMSAAEGKYASLFRTAASQDAIQQRQSSQQVRSVYRDR